MGVKGEASYRGSKLSTYLPTCLPACLPAYLPTYLPAYLPACLPTYLSICPSVYTYLPVYPSVYTYPSMPTCLCLPVYVTLIRSIESFIVFAGWSFERLSCGSGDGRVAMTTVVWL